MSFIIGVILAILGIYIGLEKYYREKWWEKKFLAFTNLLEYIYIIEKYNEYFYKLEMSKVYPEEHIDVPRINEDMLESEYRPAKNEIRKLYKMSRLLLGKDIEYKLGAYLQEIDEIYDSAYWGGIETIDAYSETFEKIQILSDEVIKTAKIELKRQTIITCLTYKFWALSWPKKFRDWCYKDAQ